MKPPARPSSLPEVEGKCWLTEAAFLLPVSPAAAGTSLHDFTTTPSLHSVNVTDLFLLDTSNLAGWGLYIVLTVTVFSSFLPGGVEHHVPQLADVRAADLVLHSLDDSQQKEICHDQLSIHGCLRKSTAHITVHMEF